MVIYILYYVFIFTNYEYEIFGSFVALTARFLLLPKQIPDLHTAHAYIIHKMLSWLRTSWRLCCINVHSVSPDVHLKPTITRALSAFSAFINYDLLPTFYLI